LTEPDPMKRRVSDLPGAEALDLDEITAPIAGEV
jgi:hypothetical protein